MSHSMRNPFVIVVAVVSVAARVAVAAPSYEQDVVPILRTYCSGCHNDADKEGELSVERFATLRRWSSQPARGPAEIHSGWMMPSARRRIPSAAVMPT
jgi:hypothetical protein